MFTIEKKIFFPVYHFKTESEYFGTLRAQKLRPQAKFIAKESNYLFIREKWFEGNYYCEKGDDTFAVAYKPHGIGLEYFIEYDNDVLFMKPGSDFVDKGKLEYDIFKQNKTIGRIFQNPTKFLLKMEFDPQIYSIVQCFAFWLAFRAWSCERAWQRVDRGWWV